MNEKQLETAALALCEIRNWKPDGLDHAFGRSGDPLKSALDHCKQEILSFYQVAKAVDITFSGKEFP